MDWTMKTNRLFCLLATALTLASCDYLHEDISNDDNGAPTVAECSASLVPNTTKIELSSSYDADNIYAVSEAYFVYGNTNDLSSASKVAAEIAHGNMSATIDSHNFGSTLYYKAVVANSIGQSTGSSIASFQIPSFDSYVNVSAPEQLDVTTEMMVISAGYSVSEGISITEKGFYWIDGLDKNPATESEASSIALEGEDFVLTLENLEPGHTYSICAYIKDADGNIAYGPAANLCCETALPTVEFRSYESSSSTATIYGEITHDGGADITARGISYSKTVDFEDSKYVKAGEGAGEFSVTLFDLTESTTYYARLTAENLVGTAYSEIFTFKTDDIHVMSVSLDKESVDLYVAESVELVATVLPENASDKSVTWKSSAPEIASVDENGKVQANKAGKAVIEVSTVDGGKTASCEINVSVPPVYVESISLNYTELRLEEGDFEELKATVLPEDADNKAVVWSTSDAKVATVEEGLVIAVGPGEATITVTSAENSNISASCSVIVPQHVESVSLDKSEMTLAIGEKAALVATVLPENAENRAVTWTSSDTAVATVDANGNVSAISVGEAVITVETVDLGLKASCAVTVYKPVVNVESVSISKSSLSLKIGDSATLTATVLPEDADNKEVTWSSSDESIATVDNGKVTAIAAGDAVITVTTEDGGKTASCAVTVNEESGDVDPGTDPDEPGTDPDDPDEPVEDDQSVPEISFVDLGLSVKWGSSNLGTKYPSDNGRYYAWAETSSKLVYDWNHYFYMTSNNITKYGSYDNKGVLEAADDAASVRLNADCHIPTEAEWNELKNSQNCDWTWTDDYNESGVSGYIVTSKMDGYTDNSIFFPTSGYKSRDEFRYEGTYGYYWSSSISTTQTQYAIAFIIGQNPAGKRTYPQKNSYQRYLGMSIRPVQK